MAIFLYFCVYFYFYPQIYFFFSSFAPHDAKPVITVQKSCNAYKKLHFSILMYIKSNEKR